MMMMNRCCGILGLAVLAGCSESERQTATTRGGTVGQAATPRAQPSVSTEGWTVSPSGIGNVRTEMTLAQAGQELGTQLAPPASGAEQCGYVQPVPGLDSVAFMVVSGRIARVDVMGRRFSTVEGARVGDTEARIDSLYRGRVEVQPHKYTDGHYLVVRPMERGSAYRIVFETDGNRVTRYRAGRLPEVGWVEGCS